MSSFLTVGYAVPGLILALGVSQLLMLSGKKGDELIQKLADRLAAVDLLEKAAGLLEQQIEDRQ